MKLIQSIYLSMSTLLGIAIISGCSTMNSRMVDSAKFEPKTAADGRGIAYFLPVVRLKVTAIRTNSVTSDTTSQMILVTNVAYAKTILTRSTRATTLIGGVFETNRGYDAYTGMVNASGHDFTNNVSTNSVDISNLESFSNVTTVVSVPMIKTTNMYSYNVVIEEVLERDRHCLCMFEQSRSMWSSDQLSIQITNGLIQSISMTNDDQTLTALENLVSAAAKIYATVQSGGLAAFGANAETKTIQVIFDPSDPDERMAATNKLYAFGVAIDLGSIPLRATKTSNYTTSSVNGIFYRPFLPYSISWDAGNSSGAQTAHLPNSSPILHWDLNRALFVKQTAAVSFATGEPTMVSLSKPSQIGAVSEFPLNLANQIASLPANILQAKFDITSKQTQIATQYNALIQATLQLSTNQAALEQRMRYLESNRVAQAAVPTKPATQPVEH